MIITRATLGPVIRSKANCHTDITVTHGARIGSIREYVSGSSEVRKALTKGDHVHATEYWARFEKVDEPSGIITGTEYFTKSYPLCVGAVKSVLTSQAPEFSGVPPGWHLLIPSIVASDKDMVYSMSILKAQANLRKQLTAAPLLFVERKATLKSIKRYSIDILKSIRKIQLADVARWKRKLSRKPSKRELKKLASSIADRHLEFIFGIMPVINDIDNLISEFDEFSATVRTGRGRHAKTWRDINTYLDKKYFVHHRTIQDSSTYSARTSLRCEITSRIANNASLIGFNPIYTWYDLTPLSFLVGWFSNLNLWLQSLDPMIGLTYVTGSTTTKTHKGQVVTVNFTGQNPAKYELSPLTLPPVRAEYTEYIRNVHSTMPDIQAIRLMDNTGLFAYAAGVSLSIQRMINDTERVIRKKPFKYRRPKPRYLPPIKYKRV